jgi:hypothetical protein
LSSYRLRDAFVLALFSLVSLRQVMAPTERCHHPPTDFANAALVARGEELETGRVFRLDRRGFSAYRLHGRKPFPMLP